MSHFLPALRRTLWIALVVTALGLAGCRAREAQAAAPTEPGDGPPFYDLGFHEYDCPFEVLAGEEITCGYLTVPQDRELDGGITIDLAVAIIKASGSRPRPDPIVYLEGGPGGSALSDPDYWLESPLHTARDIILLDQRGTGYSLPSLDCPEIDAYDNEDDSGYDALVDAAQACRDRLVLDGVDLAQYNSVASATDVEELRLALGIDQWNLYGVSYGTKLALTVMRDYPHGVRSAVIDSVYPPNVEGYTEEAANGLAAIDRLIDGCADDEECNDAFPGLKRRFYAAVARLNDEPGELDGDTYSGDDLVNFLFNSLYDSALIPYLPLVIDAAANDDFEPWQRLDAYANGDVSDGGDGASARILPRQDDPADNPASDEFPVNDGDAQGAFYSVECNEAVPFSDYDEAAALMDGYPGAVAEGQLASLEESYAVCEIWGAGKAGPVEHRAVASDIPTLVLAGEYDPITPTRWSKLAAKTLPNSFYVEAPRGGHGVSFDDDCGQRLVRAFLNRPDRRPNASCMEELLYPFVLSADELPE